METALGEVKGISVCMKSHYSAVGRDVNADIINPIILDGPICFDVLEESEALPPGKGLGD
jgi:hypothetical protein